MTQPSTRREFLRQLAAIGLGAGSAVWLSACGAQRTPELTRITLDPTGTPLATATKAHTATRTLAPADPTSTATDAPADPTATMPADPTATTPHDSTATSPAATSTATSAPAAAYLAIARGSSPAEITRRAIAALGGMGHFVKPGDDVIVKPNICNAYHGPEYASTTNPEVVGAVVALCVEAGAKRVRVMDYPFGGTAKKAYSICGIADTVKAAGGQMEVMSRIKFRKVDIPAGRKIQKWSMYGDVLDADVLINVPIAKHHGSARLTLAMKNLMGVIEDRGGFHSRDLHQCIADLSTLVVPQLTVVDAVRMLMNNGPTGGDLNDVKLANTVIASADTVAADTYAAGLFGLTPDDVRYIQLGAEMGLGRTDLGNLSIEEIQV